MKVKAVSRSAARMSRETRDDLTRVHRNLDPTMHPFEKAREYKRALTAVKMDRMFAKPFVAALDGHADGVSAMAASPTSLVAFVSGSCDGEVRVWDLAHHKCLWSAYAHSGFVRGLSVDASGECFFSAGDDKTVKQWRMGTVAGAVDEVDEASSDSDSEGDGEAADGAGAGAGAAGHSTAAARGGAGGHSSSSRRASGGGGGGGGRGPADVEPLSSWTGREAFHAIDCHWEGARFATASSRVDVWDYNRSAPVQSFPWGSDSVTAVRFNPAERDLLASAGADRSIGLYDLRTSSALRKLVMDMRSNALRWNPREPFNFTTANEDHQCYTFDMRKLDRALMVHKGHVSAVMDISYSPTGREFVTGSYDRTVRIFNVREGKSREVYHTRRMQRIFCVQFSADARYVLSGSDDTNIRVWRAKASERAGRLSSRERASKDYRNTLAKRYGHLPEVRRIATHRHVPAGIMKASKRKFEADAREVMKDQRRRAHTDPAKHKPREPERKKRIVKELE